MGDDDGSPGCIVSCWAGWCLGKMNWVDGTLIVFMLGYYGG